MASPLAKPQPPSPPPPPLDLEAAVREVTRGYELASELHTLLREVIPRGDGRLESACRLSKDVQQTLASALSVLKPTRKARFRAADPLALEISLPCSNSGGTGGGGGGGVGGGESRTSTVTEARVLETEDGDQKNSNSRKRSLDKGTMITYEISEESQHCKKNGDQKKSRKTKIQRTSHLYSWTTITCTPFNDGHQWRKYGEKKISQCAMPRCYYRCTHKDDQGCPATKQVQQKDCEDPPTFVVTYNKQHTCKKNLLFTEQFVIEPPITDPCQLSL